MKENKAVGPNLKTYFYYTNEMADRDDAKGTIVIATGIESTGVVYDEIGDYLDKLGFAMYAIDEWGYGKTGAVTKDTKKNWKRKGFYYAAYNVHALCVLAKHKHSNMPLYLLGNDFGSMLSLKLIKEFPEVVDKLVMIGWGMPRGQDFGFYLTSLVRKLFLYDNGVSKYAHFSQNKRFALRFESGEKFAWLSSDLDQVKKIRDAGCINEPGTVGHYYYYYRSKVKMPLFSSLKKADKKVPILLLSGNHDVFTKRGLTTKMLEKYLKLRGFKNVETKIFEGRHELLFEKNRYEIVDSILTWLTGETIESVNNDVVELEIIANQPEIEIVETEVVENAPREVLKEPEFTEDKTIEFMEAEEDLLIRTQKDEE